MSPGSLALIGIIGYGVALIVFVVALRSRRGLDLRQLVPVALGIGAISLMVGAVFLLSQRFVGPIVGGLLLVTGYYTLTRASTAAPARELNRIVGYLMLAGGAIAFVPLLLGLVSE